MKNALGFILIVIFVFFAFEKTNGQSLTVGPVNGHITACQGQESINQNIEFFSVSGSGLQSNVSATATAGFEISVSEFTAYASSLTLTPAGGALSLTIYVRMAPSSAIGVIAGSVTLSSAGAPDQTAILSGTVLSSAVVNPVNNITVLNGANIPEILFSGSGNAYTWVSNMPAIGTAVSGADSIPGFTAINNSNVPVTATITVSPLLSELLYVVNDSSGTVSVVNTDLDVTEATVSCGGKGPYSECLSPDGTRLYVVNSLSANLSVISTITLKILAIIPVGNNPQYVAVSPDNSTVYVTNNFSNSVSVIDASKNQVITTFPSLHPEPTVLTLNSDGSQLYVGSGAGGTLNLDVYNTVSFARTATLSFPQDFDDIAMNVTGDKLYVETFTYPALDNIYVVDTQSNTITSSFGAGQASAGLALSPDGAWLYLDDNYHLLGVFSIATGAGVAFPTMPFFSNTLAISEDGSRLYLNAPFNNLIIVVNTTSFGVIATIPVGVYPNVSIHSVQPGGCSGQAITFTVTVNPAPLPVVTTSENNLAGLTTIYGTPSAYESFTVSGTYIRGPILVTPPKGFEVSLDDNTFSSIVSINGTGSVAPVTVYIRLAAATAAGTYSGNIALVSDAVKASVNIAESTVTLAPLSIKADNKTKMFDTPNPPLTVTYTGFVNSDTPGDLLAYPTVSTDAVLNSPAGDYPIHVGGSASQNYDITYIPGVLSVIYGVSNSSQVNIPNAFTPNGDGINDTWDIRNIGNYPDCTVQIFNRYGQMVFTSTGYGTPWDGTYKGSPLPTGTYYYIINLNVGLPLLSGYVEMIR